MTQKNHNDEDKQGVDESRQDRQQEEAARERPAQRDQQIHDDHTRRPPRKDGSDTPA